MLSDIRVQLSTMAQHETLSSDAAGLVMMVGRLLTMIEADQLQQQSPQATPSSAQAAADAALLQQLVASRTQSAAQRQSVYATIIDRYIAITAARQQQRDALAAGDVREPAAATGDPRQRFSDYLARQAGRPLSALKKFQRISGGYSKTSIAVELAPEDDFGWGTQLIVRMDVKDGPTSFTVADEFPVLRQLYGSAVPVAEPFDCQTDPAILGQPFLVSALLPGISATSGDPTVAAWGQDAALRRAVGVQLAQALGALHSLAPPATTHSASEQIRAYLQQWRQRWQNLNAPAEPALALAFDWLDDNAPTMIERLSYVHGDFAPYNALQDHGHLTAIIDWEFIHVGDPAEDVGYCRKYMESLLPWDEFLQHYYTGGGPEYHSNSAAFYEIWCNVRNAVVLLQGRQAYVSGRNRDIKVLYAPAEFYHYFLLKAMQGISAQLSR